MRGSGKQSRHAGLRYYGQTNRRGRPRQIGRKWQIGQNEPRGRPRHARSQSLLPLGSPRLLAFRLKILLYFSCCLRGRLFLRSLRLCPLSALERTNPSQKPPVGKNPRREAHAIAGLFWPNEPKETARSAFGQTIPRSSPVTPVAKQTQGAPSHDFGQTNPSCGPVRVFANRTRRATEPLVFPPNEPKVQPSAGLS